MDLINIEATQNFNDIVDNFFNNNANPIINIYNDFIPINNPPYINIMTRSIEDIMNYTMIPNAIENMIDDMIYEMVLTESLESIENTKKPDQILKIKFTPFKDNDKECSICMEKCKKDDMVTDIKCKHVFHKDCIMEWGKYKNECPNCRDKLPLK